MLRILGSLRILWKRLTAGLRATIRIKDRKNKIIMLLIASIKRKVPSNARVKITIDGETTTWVLFFAKNQSNIMDLV